MEGVCVCDSGRWIRCEERRTVSRQTRWSEHRISPTDPSWRNEIYTSEESRCEFKQQISTFRLTHTHTQAETHTQKHTRSPLFIYVCVLHKFQSGFNRFQRRFQVRTHTFPCVSFSHTHFTVCVMSTHTFHLTHE